jgi:hypothetical protein
MSSTVLNDVLPSNVPSLHPNSDNVTIFSLRILTVVDAKGYPGHFDGTVPCPLAPITESQTDELAAWDKAERNWKPCSCRKSLTRLRLSSTKCRLSVLCGNTFTRHLSPRVGIRRPTFVPSFCGSNVPLAGMLASSLQTRALYRRARRAVEL